MKQAIDGFDFLHMVAAGTKVLQSRVETVNRLNVFPVPDGDTGTNMHMTMQAGLERLQAEASPHLGKCAEVFSKGLLMGARGNSGVILSQLFRGFAKAVHAHDKADAAQFARALQLGVDTAYQAVAKPVEGTILTVARKAARHAAAVASRETDLAAVLKAVLEEAAAALAATPDDLAILKQVGVVDSGGQGLVFIYEGFAKFLNGDETVSAAAPVFVSAHQPAFGYEALSGIATEEIAYPYDMEFFIHTTTGGKPFDEEAFRKGLSQNGDSILIVREEGLVKVHVHSRAPDEVFRLALQYGELSGFHLENMRETHRRITRAPRKPFGIVTVAAGDGLADIFRSLGADAVVAGGQTMNPSTREIVEAIERIGADTVFVLPNNSNIILAANQAGEWAASGRVVVIPTKTVSQGMSALIAFDPRRTVEENEAAMTAALARVKSGQITRATRDANMDGVAIRQGDYLAVLDGTVVCSEPDSLAAGLKLLERLLAGGGEVVTVLTGADAEPETTERLTSWIGEHYPDVELEVLHGGQPLYPYLFSAE